jgi:hypothetical protein
MLRKLLKNLQAFNASLTRNVFHWLGPRRKTAVLMSFVLLAFLGGFVISGVLSATQTTTTISSVGMLKAVGVGVYWDSSFTNRTTTIDWGTFDPGAQRSVTVYIRNEGNSPVAFSLSTLNWNPASASGYMSLTWNYNGQVVNAGASVPVVLTLTVSASITGVGSFNFDINIVGSG